MGPSRILGVVLLVVGIVLLVWGLNSSHSVGNQATNLVTGHFTNTTMWYIIGGIVLGLLGLLMTIFGPRSKSA